MENKEEKKSEFNIERFIRSIGFTVDGNSSNDFCKIYGRTGRYSSHEVHLCYNSDDRNCDKKAKIAFAQFWEFSDKIEKEKDFIYKKIEQYHAMSAKDIESSFLSSMFNVTVPKGYYYIPSVRKIPNYIIKNDNNIITLSTELNTIDKAVKLFKYLDWETE
jgi:hypothetical protein